MNKRFRLIVLSNLLLLAGFVHQAWAQESSRVSLDLSKLEWHAVLDKQASWKNDRLYLPNEVYLQEMPVNAPSFGWDKLYQQVADCTTLPTTIEFLFSKGINSFTYHGVSWLWCEVDIPQNWKGKYIDFHSEKHRMRMEVYINEKLAGYDLIAETPYSNEIGSVLKYGRKNRIAIRLTNPGGQRGWADFPAIGWKKYRFPASHDFTGLGHVSLEAKDQLHVQDVYIKTLQPISKKTIEIAGTIRNNQLSDKRARLKLEVTSVETGKRIYSTTLRRTITKGVYQFTHRAKLSKALPWDIDTPRLYRCAVSVQADELLDSYDVRFGLRTVEVKKRNGNPSFYVNDKRVRLRSAIDWGYYAHTGFYATQEQAWTSVDEAKNVGHNMISFHRRIGEPMVLDRADEVGLYLYEEPGGFRANGQGDCVPEGTFQAKVMLEKLRRMVLRDRNHPSLLWYTLANEDPSFNPVRKEALLMVNRLDDSRFVANSSGWGKIECILPYDSIITNDFVDDHTVEEHKGYICDRIPRWGDEKKLYEQMLHDVEKRDRTTESESRFRETEFFSHQKQNDSCLVYWGEVRCFTGPPNWIKTADMQKSQGYKGYDMNIYKPMADKLKQFFQSHDFKNTGSGRIQKAEDLSEMAGKGLMYIDGRIEQILLANDMTDGYAINGWTSGPQLPLVWESAILDEGRNLKGPAEEFRYWNNPNQVAIFRQNGKYFQVGDTACFKINLINEGILAAGDYTLSLEIRDGTGEVVQQHDDQHITVVGGDTYAQSLIENYPVVMQKNWKAGHISLCASLKRRDSEVSRGVEQVLLQNRPSYYQEMKNRKGLVFRWRQAEQAVKETGATIAPYKTSATKVDYILGGAIVQNNGGLMYYGPVRHTPPPTYLWDKEQSADVLRRVREDGTTLILNFNEKWAAWLFNQGILTEVPLAFAHDPKTQTKFWDGNGWGYIDYFCGNQSIPAVSTIGTSSWEPPTNPKGFYPFESDYPTKVYGAYFENGGKIRVLIGEVQYGKGRILLSRTYSVNANHAFNDLLFFNMILKKP